MNSFVTTTIKDIKVSQGDSIKRGENTPSHWTKYAYLGTDGQWYETFAGNLHRDNYMGKEVQFEFYTKPRTYQGKTYTNNVIVNMHLADGSEPSIKPSFTLHTPKYQNVPISAISMKDLDDKLNRILDLLANKEFDPPPSQEYLDSLNRSNN